MCSTHRVLKLLFFSCHDALGSQFGSVFVFCAHVPSPEIKQYAVLYYLGIHNAVVRCTSHPTTDL